jgi:hypothetical protein
MSYSWSDQIKEDLRKAKSEGQLRSHRVREIVRAAMTAAMVEVRSGAREVKPVLQDVVSSVLDSLSHKVQDTQEDVAGSIRGLVEGISASKRQTIAELEQQVQELQVRIDREEAEMQSHVDATLAELEDASQQTSDEMRSTIRSVIDSLKDSEEMALMKKRYAQLRAQLSILRANIATRYGGQFEEIEQHLESAKRWYTNAKAQAETRSATGEATVLEQKQAEFEAKLGEAGSAIARQEQAIKQRLRDLWHIVIDLQKKD